MPEGLLRSLMRCVRERLRRDDKVTVESVSKELGYTRQYVSGSFRRATGRLLGQFLKQKRLEKAARLLKKSQMRITEVSSVCGFDSANYFRHEFRQRFGMSPRQFRQRGSLRALSRNRWTAQTV